MTTTTACPSFEELAGIGTGECAGSCPPGMAIHIERCPLCREFLERRVHGGLESVVPRAAELPTHDALPQIDGFTVERELGRGAMGVVYLARRESLRRQVALKLLPGGRRSDPRQRRQWLREAEAASLVRHPGVVTLHEVAEVDNWFLLVLEYIPGGTLADRLSEPMSPRNAARLTEAIARAVHYIHLCGQLHLDLKPSNILLDGPADAVWEAMTPKVSDFGIARSDEPGATETGEPGAGGTPSYMAPEQITQPRRNMTARADIHGLGAILYHMLTGRPPYQGVTVLETIELVRRQEPIPPRRLNPKIPADLETICLKSLEKDPLRRYSTAKLVADDLSRWQEGRPISARPVLPLGKSWRWCRRRPVVAALAAALALTLSFSFVVVTLLWRQAEANFRMSSEVITDLVDLSVGGEQHLPKVMTLDRQIPLLERVRRRVLTLATSRPDDPLVAGQLDFVERRLGQNLLLARRHDDARTMLLESLARLELLARRNPADETVRNILSHRLFLLAEVSDGTDRIEDSVMYLRHSIRLGDEAVRLEPSEVGVTFLLESRRALARLLYRLGDRQQAGLLFADNARLLDGLPTDSAGLNTPFQRLLAHVDSRLFLEGSPPATASGNDACGKGDCGPMSRLSSPTDASQAPQEWARLAALALHTADGRDAASAARLESEDTLKVTHYLIKIGSTFRRLHDIDGSRRIAERTLALANHSVAAYPNQPAARLALSGAYIQCYKNAFLTEDRGAVEVNMKLALDAARAASQLDPTSETAQQAVYVLQRKYVDLHESQ